MCDEIHMTVSENLGAKNGVFKNLVSKNQDLKETRALESRFFLKNADRKIENMVVAGILFHEFMICRFAVKVS